MRELSITPHNLPEIRYILRQMQISEMKALADKVLSCATGDEAQEVLAKFSKTRLQPLVEAITE